VTATARAATPATITLRFSIPFISGLLWLLVDASQENRPA
jgi:hypothetical protein